jgi:membrane protein implicated in regulation of membrane protease activity
LTQLILADSKKNGLVSLKSIGQSAFIGFLGGAIYADILSNLGYVEGFQDSFTLAMYIFLIIFFILLINFILLKSIILLNLIVSLVIPFGGISTLFISLSLAIYLNYQSFYVYSLYLITFVVYFCLEYVDAKYTPLNEYISKLNRDRILKRVDSESLGYEFHGLAFYMINYFQKVTHPLSKFNKVIQGIAMAASVIIIPMGQKEVYVDKDFDDSTYIILMIVMFCISLMLRHHFTNIIMVHRLKKALKNGELTVDQVLAVKKADGIPLVQ